MCLAVVPNLNPDGAIRKQRTNARGIDLNRDHQLLAAAETRALHGFVRPWRPHLVLDVHTYPPRRKRLLAVHSLIHCHDVFLDVPDQPGVGNSPGFLQPILARTERPRVPQRAVRPRHRVREGAAQHAGRDRRAERPRAPLRHPRLAHRGRSRRATTPPPTAPTCSRQSSAVEVAVRWAAGTELLTGPSEPAEWVAIRCRRRRADGPCTLWFRDAHSGAVREGEMPGVFYPN